MSDQNPFSTYEYVGVIAPGSVLVAVASFLPGSPIHLTADTSLGSLGIFLIAAFVSGHLLQAIGNLVETALWQSFGGMPSTWPLTGRRQLLSDNQTDRVRTQLLARGIVTSVPIQPRQAFLVGRELFVRVSDGKSADRLGQFNNSYGLLRGIAAAFLVCSAVSAIAGFAAPAIALLLAAFIALYRMYRFGIHYARELYLRFLALP